MPYRAPTLQQTAIHEAGHAIAALVVGLPFVDVTIIPHEDYLGRLLHAAIDTTSVPECGDDTAHEEIRQQNHVIVCLAGVKAERRVRGQHNWIGADHDIQNALDLALHINGDAKTASVYLKWLGLRTEAIIIQQWQAIQAIADALLVREILTYAEVLAVWCDISSPAPVPTLSA